MKNKIGKWSKHILMSDKVSFRVKDRDLIKLGFEMDLDKEIKEACKSDWIDLECRWRNVGYK